LGVLSTLDVVTSVSGGSILNGFLAQAWRRLEPEWGVFTNFDEHVTRPIEAFCTEDLRTPLLVGARLDPRNWG
jgi:NTE family protein